LEAHHGSSCRFSGQAIEKLKWYASRWKIETFHKILKSGCKAEESKLRTADRLVNLISIFCILSWSMPAAAVFSETERRLLDHLVPDRASDRPLNKSLSVYIY
jgi:hypothetical protein